MAFYIFCLVIIVALIIGFVDTYMTCKQLRHGNVFRLNVFDLYEDPFNEEGPKYVTILDVKKNKHGKFFVKYQYNETKSIKTDLAINFLERFKFVKKYER